MTRRFAGCAAVVLALACAGCGDSANSTTASGDTLSVYSILPLQGASGPVARDVADGEKLALQQARGQVGNLVINFRSVDSAPEGRVTAATAAAAARKAAQDPSAIAAVGALDAAEAQTEIPLLNEASVALVTTATGPVALDGARLYPNGQPTFSRVIGDDRSQARAVAALAARERCSRLRLYAGGGPQDVALAAAVGERVHEILQGRRGGHPCAFLAFSDPVAAARRARAVAPQRVLAAAALATPAFARALGPAARSVTLVVPRPVASAAVSAAFSRAFGRPASRNALLGYGAMRAVLTAVRQSGSHGNDRAVVARHLRRPPTARWGTAHVRGMKIALSPGSEP